MLRLLGSQLEQVSVEEEDNDNEPTSRKKQIKKKDLDTAIIDQLEKTEGQTLTFRQKWTQRNAIAATRIRPGTNVVSLPPLRRHL